MNPIISNLYNRPSDDFYQKKLKLNDEFQVKSKIQGLVSCIYYPAQSDHPLYGHSELEFEGASHSLMGSDPTIFKPKSLDKMIRLSDSGQRLPFVRFPISVTPNQLEAFRKTILTRGFVCSVAVAKNLALHGDYAIPLPFTCSPLALAGYLTCAKTLGSKRITRIEFHGNAHAVMHLAKAVHAMMAEFLALCMISLSARIFLYISKA